MVRTQLGTLSKPSCLKLNGESAESWYPEVFIVESVNRYKVHLERLTLGETAYTEEEEEEEGRCVYSKPSHLKPIELCKPMSVNSTI